MTKLSELTPQRTTPLIQVLLNATSPTSIPPSALSPKATASWPPSLLSTLNPSQQTAILHALASPEISLIHGPPGTGKTHTLIALIQLLLQQNQRILVCGPSNLSVDNLVERLSHAQKEPGAIKTPFLRLGHPARLLPAVLDHSLDVLSRHSSAAEILSSVRSELDAKTSSIAKTRSGRERRAIYAELKTLRAEFREREKRVVRDLLKESRVIFATLHGAGGKLLRDESFDVLIVDEAAQALEAQCWIPVLLSGMGVGKLILAGDHLQLGPTIMSKASGKKVKMEKTKKKKAESEIEGAVEALRLEVKMDFEKTTLETALFSRLLALYGEDIKTLLNVQYRMHASICAFPSATLYDNKLVSHPSVATRLLTDLRYEKAVLSTEDTLPALVFYDTQGGLFPEAIEDTGSSAANGRGRAMLAESKSNPDEAAVVALHLHRLVEAGVREEDIGVITPYNAQLAVLGGLIRERFPAVELGSVDGFQGREKEVVVLTLVRSNEGGEVGFLGEERRLNGLSARLCYLGFRRCGKEDGVRSLSSADPRMCCSGYDTREEATLRYWRFGDGGKVSDAVSPASSQSCKTCHFFVDYRRGLVANTDNLTEARISSDPGWSS